jgi:hypothetical protein
MSSVKYVCGADITFKNNVRYAASPMGVFDTVEEAVICNSELHYSWGYAIYAVEPEVVHGLTFMDGILSGKKTSGYKVISKECEAYDHSAWKRRTPTE